jgi:hypothetical protein
MLSLSDLMNRGKRYMARARSVGCPLRRPLGPQKACSTHQRTLISPRLSALNLRPTQD